MKSVWSVAVFAHNEADTIARCLDAIRSDDPEVEIRIEVLVNGTRDNTMAIVGAYDAGPNRTVTGHDIQLGDKSNAWNLFTHEFAGEADIYFYTDGDCWIEPGSLDAVAAAMRDNSVINAVSTMPLAGRSKERWRASLLANQELTGNLYALTPAFVRRLRDGAVRLPVGMIGDDSLMGALCHWDLKPFGEWRDELVLPCEAAGFHFQPLSVFSLDDLRQQFRRMIRYSIRWWQLRMLDAIFREEGIAGMPAHVDILYRRKCSMCKARRDPTWFMWDVLAIRRMRRAALQA